MKWERIDKKMNGEKMKFPEEQTMQAVLIKSSPGV